MADQSNQRTFAERAEIWLKVQKQPLQQQHRQQHPVEQQHHEQQHDKKPQEQQLSESDQMKMMTLAEQAELWYKMKCSQQQPQQKHDQQYSQEQKQKQQQQKVQQAIQQEQQPLQQNNQHEHKSLQTSGLTGRVPIQPPGLTGQGPIQTSGLTGPGPIQTPGLTRQGHIQTPGLTGQDPIQTPGLTGQGPIQTPGLTGRGPIQTPGLTGQDPIQTPGLTGQGPVQTPGLTGPGPVQTPGLTRQGPVSANKVSLSQHPDAHGQVRLSAQMSPTQAYSKEHVQQHPQQHTGVDKKQPIHDSPQSIQDSDAMSLSPSIPHLQKRAKLSETSSTDDTRNTMEASEKQGFIDESHAGANVQLQTHDLRDQDGRRKGGRVRTWKKKKEQSVSFLHNLRCGQIIELDVSEMEDLCCWEKIKGKGSFGTVYEAKIDTEEEIGRYVIKKIEVAEYDELRRKSYEREIHHGRILHPHIIPIIARAEDISRLAGTVYLMYPFMENGSVRENIEKENRDKRNPFCNEDRTNSKIWLRCIYQVSQALDYLHNPGKNNLRGPVFHRDLTSRNILFDEVFNAKICDFGIAVEAKYHAKDATATPLQRSVGYHPRSMNPTRYRAYDDVYSFCVLILEILTGEIVKSDEPFKSYKIEDLLIDAINTRAKKVKVAKWPDEDLRDHLAKKAWEVIAADDTGGKADVTAADFFKGVHLETHRRYQQPKNPNRCVSCCINPTANLPLMGEKCKSHSPPCAMYCIHCLSDHHNRVVCPLHGPSRPPFGDHVYGVFVAGNHVKDLQGDLKMTGEKQVSLAEIAGIFSSDAKTLVNVLTSKFPLILGVR